MNLKCWFFFIIVTGGCIDNIILSNTHQLRYTHTLQSKCLITSQNTLTQEYKRKERKKKVRYELNVFLTGVSCNKEINAYIQVLLFFSSTSRNNIVAYNTCHARKETSEWTTLLVLALQKTILLILHYIFLYYSKQCNTSSTCIFSTNHGYQIYAYQRKNSMNFLLLLYAWLLKKGPSQLIMAYYSLQWCVK